MKTPIDEETGAGKDCHLATMNLKLFASQIISRVPSLNCVVVEIIGLRPGKQAYARLQATVIEHDVDVDQSDLDFEGEEDQDVGDEDEELESERSERSGSSAETSGSEYDTSYVTARAESVEL